MHPQLLERATHGFKVGYWHARDRRPPRYTRENDNGTFAAHDYIEGWEAFMNELYWDAVRENEARDRV